MELTGGFFSLPGGSEWIIIFLVILIIFGPKSLPKIGHAIGRGIREFKDASDGITKAIEEETSALERGESTRSEATASSPEVEGTDSAATEETERHGD